MSCHRYFSRKSHIVEFTHSHNLQFVYDIQSLYPTIQLHHYSEVIMSPVAPKITNLTIIYSTVYSGADHRKHQSSVSLGLAQRIHRWPVNSLHKGQATWKIFPFDDVIMIQTLSACRCGWHDILYASAHFNSTCSYDDGTELLYQSENSRLLTYGHSA